MNEQKVGRAVGPLDLRNRAGLPPAAFPPLPSFHRNAHFTRNYIMLKSIGDQHATHEQLCIDFAEPTYQLITLEGLTVAKTREFLTNRNDCIFDRLRVRLYSSHEGRH